MCAYICIDSSLSPRTGNRAGVLLAVWFAGTEENSPDVAILSARYEEGTWKLPVEVVPPLER